MQDEQSTFFKLVIIGAIIGIGKVLSDGSALTVRLVAGRVVLGSATSLVAGLLLIQFPDINELGLVGAASALGILGSTVIESLLKGYLSSKVKEEKNT